MKTTLRLVPRQAILRPVFQQPCRAFSSAQRLRLKEDQDRSPEEVEKQKQEQKKPGAGWNRETASVSEDVVGADQEKVKDHDKHMEDLQKQTARESEKEKGKA